MNMKRFNNEKLKNLLEQRNLKQTQFAQMLGITQPELSKISNGKTEPTTTIVKLMAVLLSVTEEELYIMPKEKPTDGAAELIANNELLVKISELKTEIETQRRDLQMMAKMLIEINKTLKETKGQAELNHEETVAVFQKATECNQTINKIYSKIIKKY